jgi:hypothetical protein
MMINPPTGTPVSVIDENGNLCATGTYHGCGIPSKDLKAAYPNIKHYAVFVEGVMRYYPTGFHTLQAARN